MRHKRHLPTLVAVFIFVVAVLGLRVPQAAQSGPAVTINSSVPNELNPPFNSGTPSTGGAPDATPAQAYAFAWQEFIALNWPAGPQEGQPNQRDMPSSSCRFGEQLDSCPLLVWETFRGKVEIFPGNSIPGTVVPPPGYPGPSSDTSFGYDALPAYNYSSAIEACTPQQKHDSTPWVNLDETDQITLDNMYAGVAPDKSPGNSAPQLIRFLAKANRSQYVYIAGNSSATDWTKQWWSSIPQDVVDRTKTYLADKQASPPQSSKTMVSLPYGTIEMKAGWRPLNQSEMSSGRFHTQKVRFYEFASGETSECYRDATWGLVALHIIQKTPSAPYFIYATFEQADNILTASGTRVEDEDGKVALSPQPSAPTSPQVCLVDPRRPVSALVPNGQESTSALGSVILTMDPQTCKPTTVAYCNTPGSQLYLRNANHTPLTPNSEPSGGNICINKRENAIPDDVIAANQQAHAAMKVYLNKNGISSAPWLSYKLVNVQFIPYDKVINVATPNGSLYTATPPYTAANPSPSTFYQANIVVETNRSLQLFSGGLSPNIATDWNSDGTAHRNTYYAGHFYNMGGCLGCHGSQGQNPQGLAGDFSVILARGSSGTGTPEPPAKETSHGLSVVPRNRILSN